MNAESDRFKKREEGQPRRTWFDLWGSILDFLIYDEATLSRIVVLANLNRAAARRHLDKMVEEKLVKIKQSRFKVYSITDEGVNWLKRYKSLAGTRLPSRNTQQFLRSVNER
jgi:predicted transcriptional regulator